ncbi:amino acid adenylation domain-containing protein [Sorangium sp. So ce176]|uniref:amino acid adenylation domain-containing protein n=1 Tax=Sorangium sp. So ce176 TaxID=3133286 RepID=UPI003F5ECF0E
MESNRSDARAISDRGAAEPATLVALLRRRAEQRPSAHAYTFLLDGESDARSMTYGELDLRARALAAELQAGARAGERALLLVPPGLDFIAAFFGCLYAGLVAVPVPLPQRKSGLLRVLAIVRDCRPSVVLTTEALLGAVAMLRDDPSLTELSHLRFMTVDAVQDGQGDAWRAPRVTAETLAFLQYTSGSTGTPKGVVLTHGNLLRNELMIQRAFAHTEESVIVGWLPPHHDMGLIGNILQPLYVGVPCVQLSPDQFLMKPRRWLEAISRYRATTSGGPNFAYELCIRKIPPEQRGGLDLGSWQVAFNGAEPIRAATLDRFAEAFAPAGFRRDAFYPCYGLAEATLLVTGGAAGAPPIVRAADRAALAEGRAAFDPRDPEAGVPLVGCGGSPAGDEVRIVDPETFRACEDERVGEIWVAGASVAQGYWERPEDTAATFDARLSTGEGPFLRTGDLGFFSRGELYVTGRLKDLIIVRGRNIYPQDIELTAEESHPGLRAGGGAAFSVDVDGEERVVVVQELGRRAPASTDPAELGAAIERAVADRHEVAVHAVVLIKPGSLPRTTSGKVQRRACRGRFLDGSLGAVWQSTMGARAGAGAEIAEPPRSALESTLAGIWAEVLGRARVGRDEEFLSLGGDSLRAMQVSGRVSEALGVDVGPAQLFESTTVAALAAWIEARQAGAPAGGAAGGAASMTPMTRPDRPPLSPVQERLWFLEQLVAGAPVYHIAAALRLHGALDTSALEQAVTALVARHEALRTSFPTVAGQPAQKIAQPGPVALPIKDLSALAEEDREPALQALLREEARRAFDLAEAPPVRWTLVRVSEREHALALTCHHLIVDGWSMNVLQRELSALYGALAAGRSPALAPLSLQPADHALWQRRNEQTATRERELAYWRERLKGPVPPLDLPTDRPRPSVQTYAGAREGLALPPELVARLGALGRRAGTTLFTTVAAGLFALLHRYTGQSDVCVGTPVATRSRAALQGVVGCFLNTLALRVDLAGNPSVAELLARVRAAVTEGQAHQEAPFEQVLQALSIERSLSRTPLFNVMLAMDPTPEPAPEIPGLSIDAQRVDTGTAQFDLVLNLALDGQGARGAWEYNTDLLDAATVARMTRHLLAILEGFVTRPESRLAELPVMDAAERRQVLVGWNATGRAYPEERRVHERFEAQAERTPDAVAVIFDEERLSYRALNERANQVAHALRKRGVGPDVLVAIAAERSVELVVGLLGVLKAGGAYVPIDPEYPADRIAFMLDDAAAPVLLSQRPVASRLPAHGAEVLCLDSERAEIDSEPTTNPAVAVSPDNLAYTIYTSGSTGRPKGAGNSHRGLLNRLQWMQERYGLTPDDRVLQKTPFSFDVSVWEFFWPLMTGACLVVARPGDHRDGERLVELITRHGVTTLHFVPPMLQAFLETPGASSCRSLRRVICSGEALPAELARRCFERLERAELHNLYGPTEASIDVTSWACQRQDTSGSVPIGTPIANTQIYLLDRHGQPVPAGVAGELHIGGVGLARGYNRRPDLTAERFVPDPFGPTPGGRLYRTGDLARYRPDGAIEFLGRLDHQVKLRGFRVEPGEIEAVLTSHPAARESLVALREDTPGDKRLVAYLVPDAERARPVRELLRLEREGHLADRPRHELPNGMAIIHQNKGETDFLYGEIFEDEAYTRHGITLRDGCCVFDIGANIGMFALYVSRACRGARIYAFEPIPPLFEVLRLNARIHGVDAALFACGLASVEQQAEFTYYPHNTAISGRFADAADDREVVKTYVLNQQAISGKETLSEEVLDVLLSERLATQRFVCPLRRLSDVIREHGVERIDLLKIDAEKSELDIIGGVDPDDWRKIEQIVLEVHDIDGRLQQITALLRAHGYEVAVEQSRMLAHTGLYDVYARRPSEHEPATARKGALRDAERTWASPGRLVSDIRGFAATKLAEHMIPAAFVLLEELPLSPNGKVDRKALPAPRSTRSAAGRALVAPRTDLERAIAEVWQDVLSVPQVGVHDNFFDLGGHSLLLPRIHGRLRGMARGELPMLVLFQHPTIASLAEALSQDPSASPAPQAGERDGERTRAAQQRRGEIFARRRGGLETKK